MPLTLVPSRVAVPSHTPRRAQTVAISKLAPPGHGWLATARYNVEPEFAN